MMVATGVFYKGEFYEFRGSSGGGCIVVSPSAKRSLRVFWYGLTLSWSLAPDFHGRPYHLSANDDGRALPYAGDARRSVTPQRRQARR